MHASSRGQEWSQLVTCAAIILMRSKKTYLAMLQTWEHHKFFFFEKKAGALIDFILARREDKRDCLDCKVIPGECVVPQHKLVVADFRLRVRVHRDKCAKIARTKWWKLRGEAAQAFKERMLGEVFWEGEDADDMWLKMATCVRKVPQRYLA